MSAPLTVVAHLKAAPGKQSVLHTVLEALVTATRQEAGCLRYDLMTNLDDETDFVILEEWQGKAALEAHFETDHIATARAAFDDLLGEPGEIRLYR